MNDGSEYISLKGLRAETLIASLGLKLLDVYVRLFVSCRAINDVFVGCSQLLKLVVLIEELAMFIHELAIALAQSVVLIR